MKCISIIIIIIVNWKKMIFCICTKNSQQTVTDNQQVRFRKLLLTSKIARSPTISCFVLCYIM